MAPNTVKEFQPCLGFLQRVQGRASPRRQLLAEAQRPQKALECHRESIIPVATAGEIVKPHHRNIRLRLIVHQIAHIVYLCELGQSGCHIIVSLQNTAVYVDIEVCSRFKSIIISIAAVQGRGATQR